MLTYSSSIFLSKTLQKPIIFDFLYEKSSTSPNRFISLIIGSISEGTSCVPTSLYSLNPLSVLGLWEAVIMIPPKAFTSLTAKDSSGVGLKESNI